MSGGRVGLNNAATAVGKTDTHTHKKNVKEVESVGFVRAFLKHMRKIVDC